MISIIIIINEPGGNPITREEIKNVNLPVFVLFSCSIIIIILQYTYIYYSFLNLKFSIRLIGLFCKGERAQKRFLCYKILFSLLFRTRFLFLFLPLSRHYIHIHLPSLAVITVFVVDREKRNTAEYILYIDNERLRCSTN